MKRVFAVGMLLYSAHCVTQSARADLTFRAGPSPLAEAFTLAPAVGLAPSPLSPFSRSYGLHFYPPHSSVLGIRRIWGDSQPANGAIYGAINDPKVTGRIRGIGAWAHLGKPLPKRSIWSGIDLKQLVAKQ